MQDDLSLPMSSITNNRNIASPNFPTEIYEDIIDRVAVIFDDKRNRDLANCALVCRAWVPRAQMHLFTCILPIEFDDRLFNSFWQAVKQKPFLLNYTNRISIVGSKGICVYKGTTEAETTGFLATCRMPNLIHLTIQFLDLSSSHPLRSRFPILSKTLKALTVIECLTDNVNQLCRFITSFQSLTTLCLGWHVECLVGDLMQHMHVKLLQDSNAQRLEELGRHAEV